MRLSATDSLLRGWSNLLANWELMVVAWLQSLAMFLFVIGAVAIPFVALGLSLDLSSGTPETIASDLFERLPQLSTQLVLCVVAGLALLTAAFVVFCYFQAGIYGVLYAADRQALPGVGRDRRLFRTFSPAHFNGWGGRHLWRFFWFYNLAGVLFSGALLLIAIWLGFTVYSAESWGGPVAWTVGCSGALPVFFLVLVLSFGVSLGQADLPREGSGTWTATRLGFDVLVRRPGAVLLIVLCFVAANLAVSTVFVPLTLGITFGLAQHPGLMLLARALLALLQMIPGAALNVALAATLIALMRSEVARRHSSEDPLA